jgi:hypothetical protein
MPFAGVIGNVIGAGVSLINGDKSASAAKAAAAAQAAAAQRSLDFQQGVYGDTKSNLASYEGVGQNALYSLSSLYGLGGAPAGSAAAGNPATSGGNALSAFNAYTQTPAYQFALQQGQLGLNRSLAAQGVLNSGAAAKDISAYNTGYASQGFNNYLSGLSSLANLGQSSSVSQGQLGNQAAYGVNNSLNTMGTAQASGIVGAQNAQNSGLSNALAFLGNNTSSYGAPSSAMGQIGSWLQGQFSGGAPATGYGGAP